MRELNQHCGGNDAQRANSALSFFKEKFPHIIVEGGEFLEIDKTNGLFAIISALEAMPPKHVKLLKNLKLTNPREDNPGVFVKDGVLNFGGWSGRFDDKYNEEFNIPASP